MLKKYEKVMKSEYDAWYAENGEYRQKVASDERRLAFHLMPKTGWMNDPNGLCQYHGVYHIYYQYTPFEPTGELKLWGHYTTKDFVHYQDDGPVLFPDEEIDAHGVYSGSAFIEEDTMHFFYTGNLKYFDRDDYDYINSGRGSNTISFTSKNGHDFTEKQLLMTTDDYPEDMSNHVRDPKIFKKDDTYYMVLGARDHKSKGMVLLYQSKDLASWTYANRITTEEPFGYMWECPDVFELDGQYILTCCPQGVPKDGIDYENVHQAVSMKLDYDFETNDYQLKDMHLLDRGFDFYAQQTFEDEQGRRILIGWMGIPDADYTNPTVEAGWQHALTIPRELCLENGKLIQKPMEELKQLRQDKSQKAFSKECGTAFDHVVYEAEIDFEYCQNMELSMRKGITLSYQDEILTLDLGAFGAGRTTRSVKVTELEHLQIFADTTSVEIFVNHGEEVFTSRMYQLEGELKLAGSCAGTMTVYTLDSFIIEDKEK